MDANNPFSSSQRTGALPAAAAAARFASVFPPLPSVIASSSITSASIVAVPADAANPFGGGHTRVPSLGGGGGPVTLVSLINEWTLTPGPVLTVTSSEGVPAPAPLRFLRLAVRAPPPTPPTSLNSASPIPFELEEALHAAALRQYAAIVARVPPATECLATGLVMNGRLLARDLALLRCRASALTSLRRWPILIQEVAVVLKALSNEKGTDAAVAAMHWLVIMADALRGCGMWREAVFVSSATIKALRGWFVAEDSPLKNEKNNNNNMKRLPTTPVTTTPSSLSTSWLSVPGTQTIDLQQQQTSSDIIGTSIDAAISLLINEGALSLLPIGDRSSSSASSSSGTGSRATTRVIVVIAGIASGALGDAGHALGAANSATDAAAAAAEALAIATTADGTPNDAPSPNTSASALLDVDIVTPSGPPEWVSAGCALLGVARTHRAASRDAEAADALHALFGIPAWHAAGDLLLAAAAGTVSGSDVAALSPATAYAVGVLGAVRGGEALAVGRCSEALPLFETAAVALARRFLPTTPSTPPPPPTTTTTPNIFVSAAEIAKLSLAAASVCVTPSDGGASLLQAHVGAISSSAVPSSFLPDPLELLAEVLLSVAECVRRLPPGITLGPPGLPPVAIAASLLESALRVSPNSLIRAPLVTGLTSLYDAGRDPVSAAASKRLLAGVAHAYGLTHLETSAFRITAL